MTNDMARTARDLVRGLNRASLATLLPPNGSGEGAPWPYASLVLVAVDHDLSPILLLSDLAEQGLTPPEIASRLGLSRASVYRLLGEHCA